MRGKKEGGVWNTFKQKTRWNEENRSRDRTLLKRRGWKRNSSSVSDRESPQSREEYITNLLSSPFFSLFLSCSLVLMGNYSHGSFSCLSLTLFFCLSHGIENVERRFHFTGRSLLLAVDVIAFSILLLSHTSPTTESSSNFLILDRGRSCRNCNCKDPFT